MDKIINITPQLESIWERRFKTKTPHKCALVLARGGSKGIPMKNIKMLGGTPLIGWVLRAAVYAEVFDSIWVSTDNERIANVARDYGAQVHYRSEEVSKDTTSSWETVGEFLQHHPEVDIIANIQATSPCVHPFHIQEGMRMLLEDSYDSVFTISKKHGFIWKEPPQKDMQPININLDLMNRPRRQDYDPEPVENGAYYMYTRDIHAQGKTQGGRIAWLEMGGEYSVDIYTDLDWDIAEERLLRFGYHGKHPKIVKLVVIAAEGVLLDNHVEINVRGEELMSYHLSDVNAIKHMQNNLVEVRIIAEGENVVQRRLAASLGCKIHENTKNKLEVLDQWREELGLTWRNVGYMGSENTDTQSVKAAGMSACPADAHDDVQLVSHFISKYKGGQGGLREFSEQVLKVNKMSTYKDRVDKTTVYAK
ncbi:N-acylneuraminate cytidylyltransferase-like [Branchiostoma floridae]|uniref:N-acylneuraminate cytidylyltransferase n=1 Tax=Branchiostoma floridae TaxID=7739 RepID=A0A9J7LLH3_BRAFL|nr:N-acylneuraminate cytidylyltransferase-like [Branchiostoma floridae]